VVWVRWGEEHQVGGSPTLSFYSVRTVSSGAEATRGVWCVWWLREQAVRKSGWRNISDPSC